MYGHMGGKEEDSEFTQDVERFVPSEHRPGNGAARGTKTAQEG